MRRAPPSARASGGRGSPVAPPRRGARAAGADDRRRRPPGRRARARRSRSRWRDDDLGAVLELPAGAPAARQQRSRSPPPPIRKPPSCSNATRRTSRFAVIAGRRRPRRDVPLDPAAAPRARPAGERRRLGDDALDLAGDHAAALVRPRARRVSRRAGRREDGSRRRVNSSHSPEAAPAPALRANEAERRSAAATTSMPSGSSRATTPLAVLSATISSSPAARSSPASVPTQLARLAFAAQ